jgi:carboxypeptidase C (cathepsin A)
MTMFAFEHGVAGGRAMAWFSELMPIIGVSSTGMVHCSTDARGGKLADRCVNFWAKMNYMIMDKLWQRQTNGGSEDKMLMNFDTHDGIYLNEVAGMWKTEKPIYSKMLNSGIKMVITLGKYDPFYSQDQQMTWINQLEYVQGRFQQIPWSENQDGKYKVYKNLCVQYLDTGHMTMLNMPESSYELMGNMINGKFCDAATPIANMSDIPIKLLHSKIG